MVKKKEEERVKGIGGAWYESYKIDGIIVGDSISFSNLKAAIAAELDIDVSRKDIEICYIVEDKYGWTMKAYYRKKSDIFIVRSFNSENTCPMRERVLTKVQATLEFVSGVTAPKLVNHKQIYIPRDIIDDIREYYGVQISYQQAWRAKKRALSMIRGKSSAGYRRLPRYIHNLKTVYPNSYIRMHKTEEDKFMYLFIALRPFIREFNYCTPVAVVDDSHLSGAYKETFVLASTLDGACCIFPLAYGVVDTENDCSWTWFFKQFKHAFGKRKDMCVVSDRNEIIMKSNVCGNFKRSRKAISDLFYSMAKAYRKENFDKLIDKVDRIDHRVKEYLEDAGYEKWSRVHTPVNRVYETGRIYIVRLERKICSCGRFQLDEIPCSHVITVLKKKNVTDMNPYCSDYYKPDTLAKTYEIPMVPMPYKEDLSDPNNVVAETVYPPRYRRLSG
ncbi:uncharacterized protein [Solanum lycopersicum]|uniref:uncharacterized protein n=1 Tax=Solanum lycopersicum TaxID=4081 RepID=UPI003747EF94